MTTQRRPRARRSRPRIDYTLLGGSGTTMATSIISVVLLSEPSQLAEQLHVEELQLVGIYRISAAGLACATVTAFAERTGVTANFEDAGVRVRLTPANESGVPFIFRFKNINLNAGHGLRVTFTPRQETSDVTHTVEMIAKTVFRETR